MNNMTENKTLLYMRDHSKIMKEELQSSEQFKLQDIRALTNSAYIMKLNRNGMKFKAGQHITLGIPGGSQVREYSIYSAENDAFLEVLLKEVDEGILSVKLRSCLPGDCLMVEGPFGFFTIDEKKRDRHHLFIATGTGIAPFHSMAGSCQDLNYTLLHGVRTGEEAYESGFYPAERYILCTSRDNAGHFRGRVTDYMRNNPVDSGTIVYLCGNSSMIYEVYDILMSQRFPADQIKTEVYF